MQRDTHFGKKNILTRSWSFFLIISLIAGITLVGCGGGSKGPGSMQPITEEQAQQILTTQASVQSLMNDGYDPNRQAESLQSIAQQAAALPGIEWAMSDETSLTIKYREGGEQSWVFNPPMERPLYVPELAAEAVRATRSMVGNKKAVIVNAIAADPGMNIVKQPLDNMATILRNLGYTVERFDDSTADLNCFKNLGNYGVVVVLGHGQAGDNYINIQTGEVDNASPLEMVTHSVDWCARRITLMSVPWGEGDKNERNRHTRTFWAVNQRFFEYYAKGNCAFKQSLFVNLGCKGLKNSAMAEVLRCCGVSAYVGWSGTQRISPWSSWLLIALMAQGKSLSDAFEVMPDDWKKDKEYNACMSYSPSEGGSLTWGEARVSPTISLFSPLDNETVTSRVIKVEGVVAPSSPLPQCVLSVNGLSLPLQLASDATFSQEVVVQPGENVIQVMATSDHGAATRRVRVSAIFPAMAFWSRLTWDTDGTDVDLHLVPESAPLWTTSDCYYAHMVTSWGASLDVDDIDGFGPEHITATTMEPGVYKLVVHYYSSHGYMGETRAGVYVAVGNESPRYFGPRSFSNSGGCNGSGDVWEICRIRFPEGTVETLDRFYTLSGTRSLIPTKGK